MRRSVWILTAVLLAVSLLGGCGGSKEDEKRYAFLTGTEGAENERVAQAWSGMKTAASLKPCQATIYTPKTDDEEEKAKLIGTAVSDGAKVVAALGENMAGTVAAAQKKNKKTSFILLDATPVGEDGAISLGKNTCAVYLAEEEAGYLCGYALVMEGYTNLGFLGGKEDRCGKAFANGYIKGADQAAQEKALGAGSINVRMYFTGDNVLDPRTMDRALSWYESGTEVIFAPDSEIRRACEKAADVALGRVCGTAYKNVTDFTESQVLMVILDYEAALQQTLRNFEEGSFRGGEEVTYGAVDGCVRVSADYTRFRVVTETMNALAVNNLRNGIVVIPQGDSLGGTTQIRVAREGADGIAELPEAADAQSAAAPAEDGAAAESGAESGDGESAAEPAEGESGESPAEPAESEAGESAAESQAG